MKIFNDLAQYDVCRTWPCCEERQKHIVYKLKVVKVNMFLRKTFTICAIQRINLHRDMCSFQHKCASLKKEYSWACIHRHGHFGKSKQRRSRKFTLKRFANFYCELQFDTHPYVHSRNIDAKLELQKSMEIYPNFISKEEETTIMNEIGPYMRRLRYEFDHWDKVSVD